MDFESAVSIILKHEGGFVNHPSDPGGVTKYGISQRAFPNIDISELTDVEAIQIYRQEYWDRLMLEYLHPKLRLMVFDCAVNQGPMRAGLFLQRACGIASDGIIGPITVKTASEFDPDFLLDSVARQRMLAYVRNPQWKHFGAGWASRLLDITLLCAAVKLQDE